MNILPIGIRLKVKEIKSVLKQALKSKLITKEEFNSITGYRLLR